MNQIPKEGEYYCGGCPCRDIAVFECTLYELELSLDFGVPQRLTQCLKDQPRIVIEEEPWVSLK